ncbi:MAG: hypothetical protein PUB20_04540 [Clostridia bacterium]|nr:hypothetical protein [Clostridia bacterium]
MIDLHTHILPGLDDGAQDLKESLNMANMAAKNGTKIIVATPHRNLPGYKKRGAEDIKAAFEALKSGIEVVGLDVRVLCGSENFGSRDIADKLDSGQLLTINGTRYVLVEFDFDERVEEIFAITDLLLRSGYIPIVAHPERYSCFYEDLSGLYELYSFGAVLQINKGSVLGHFGRRVQYVADAILSHRLAAVAASDAHDIYDRTPDLSEFAEILDIRYGEGCSPLLLEENPKRIIEGREVFWESPVPFE